MVPWKPVSDGYFITGNLFHKCSIKPRTYHFLIFLFVTFLEANQQFFPQHKDTPHFRERHKWYTNSPFLYSHRWKRGWSWPWALTFCMEDPKTPGKFKWSGSSQWKIYRYFVNVTTQSFSCFQCQKQYQCHLMAIFHEISVQMASAPCFDTNRPALLCKSCCFYAINWNFQSIISIRKRGQPHPHVYSKVRILIDCEQSLFFFRFSENNCTRAGAAEPRDERNEGGSPRRK